MANYVTKNVKAYKVNALVFDMNANSLTTNSYTFNKKPTDKQCEKVFTSDEFKFIKVDSLTEIENLRRVETEKFMQYAHKVQTGENRANLITRTITTCTTNVLTYNLKTDKLETMILPFEVTNVKKCDLIDRVVIKVLSYNKSETLYGMDIESFVNISEEFER